ncbi:hypothetical protein [Undibacterium sp. SXout20W]|uniref:hypothetical protein n=1 Tax=Undibacterium sp. SXout20W TaxID=3413051 RepID=UPI003BF1F5C3
MNSSNLSKRLYDLVLFKTNEYRRFKQLETITGVQADTWKSWFHGRQRPTSEMIETIAKLWPQYGFWLVTGFVDNEYGHIAPMGSGYPSQTIEQANSTSYFEAVRETYAASEEVIKVWISDEIGGNTNLEGIISDAMLRSAVNMGFPDEVTQKLRNLMQVQKRAAKLRRAEILLNVEMPRISYENTEAVSDTIQALLSDLPEERKSELQRKLDLAIEQLKMHEKRLKENAKTTE